MEMAANPKLVVFDLDYTLWPFWCDTHVMPPIRPTVNGDSVADAHGDQFSFYREVPDILRSIKQEPDIEMCVASRTSTPTIAQNILSMLKIDGEPCSTMFQFTAWGTGTKVQHFKELHLHTGIDYSDMVFFDDEIRNRDVETKLGVTFVLVGGGLTRKVYKDGIELWRTRRAARQKDSRRKRTKSGDP